ncbi:MAG: type II toxin-antitoxin system VapB family antitoxin [Holophagales bacterium]|jgi:Arc/MetJ family transcription regulator|nr:type II toxin-antitoxin system VapB family antitoxin [Holophagales bacterium]
MRTNVVLDDEVMQKAMKLSHLKTKKEVIDKALREFVEIHSRKDLLELRGQIKFSDNYDYKALREGY